MQSRKIINERASEVLSARQMFASATEKGLTEKAEFYLDEMKKKAYSLMDDNPGSLAAAAVLSFATQAAYQYYEKNSSPLFTASYANLVLRRMKRELSGSMEVEEAVTILLGASVQVLSGVQGFMNDYADNFDEYDEIYGDKLSGYDLLKTLSKMVYSASNICTYYYNKVADMNSSATILKMVSGIICDARGEYEMYIDEFGEMTPEECFEYINTKLEFFVNPV